MADVTAPPNETDNKVTIEDAGPARKRLTITVPASSVDAKLEDSMATLSNEAAVPGFRKGRVPRALLERRFGEAMRTEAKNQLIAEAYSSAVEANELRALGEPEPDEAMNDLELVRGKDLSFSVEIEVVPEFEMPDLDNLALKRPVIEVTSAHIDDEVGRQLIQLGETDETDDKGQPTDRLICRASVTKNKEDEPFFENDQVLVVYPEGSDDGEVLGVMVSGLTKTLKGKKAGDDFTIKTIGPDNHEREDLRGAELEMKLNIKSIYRTTPATVEQVVERFGMENEESYREQIKLALEKRRDDEQGAAMREQVHEYLLDNIDFELPEKVSSAQVTRNLERQRMQMLYNGLTPEEVERELARIRGESEENTRKRLKLTFVLARLAQQFEIEVTEQEINGVIATAAARRGERPAALRNELAKAGRLPELASQVREQKAADRVVATARVEDISADDWNKSVEAKAGAKPTGGGTTKKKSSSKKKTTSKKPAAAKAD